MIKVESINIKEFRGIRDLTIQFEGRNFAICGPNGTGKSGIVDALEFGLTGNISRLTGKGRGELSIKDHGPHVNSRHRPEKAIVTLNLKIIKTGQKFNLKRNVKSPRAPQVSPDTPDTRAAIAYMERHPEFALSRREIIKYVLAEPGERAKEVQALLQLEKLEATRSLLLKISNSVTRECKPLESVQNTASVNLRRALGVSELKQASILYLVNERRSILGLPAIINIEPTTSIRDGLESQAVGAAIKIPKIEAKRDIEATYQAIAELNSPDAQAARSNIIQELLDLKKDERSLDGVARDSMLQTALSLYDDCQCPVCLTPWEPAEFRATVQSQREKLKLAALLKNEIDKSIALILTAMNRAHSLLDAVMKYAQAFSNPINTDRVKIFIEEITVDIASIRKFWPLDETIYALTLKSDKLGNVLEFLKSLTEAVDGLPEPSKADAARDYLTIGQERLVAWREAASNYAAAKARADLAQKVLETFGDTCDRALKAIYRDVEVEFRQFYRTINSDDETEFESQLIPSLGKLGFSVDFYGKGFFPPGAYHSEGHQDGMGLCLYLALMKHLLGGGFTFSVLDDVLMSVDSAHRREVCALLKTSFPNTQFVLTTHDQVWLKHMQTSGLVEKKSAINFRKWNVDEGPSEWKHLDVWSEIDNLVTKNEIRAAASRLRHYLEYMAAEWSDKLGAKVTYRADGRYELGDLLSSAVGEMGILYRVAKNSAQSWNNTKALEEIVGLHDNFVKAVQNSNIEQWMVNPAIHYNEWADFGRSDFEPVVRAFVVLEQEFKCGSCEEPLYVVRSGFEKQALRCGCGGVNLNLKVKPKSD